MAVIAGIAAGDVVLVFASGDIAVVARSASADDLAVIDPHHRHKQVRRVTVFANIAALDVCLAFTGSVNSVVTAHAIPGNVHVIEVRR